jgi:beta-lactamase class A
LRGIGQPFEPHERPAIGVTPEPGADGPIPIRPGLGVDGDVPIKGVRIDRDERHLNTNTIGLEWKPEYVDVEVFDKARAAVTPARRKAAFHAYQKDERDTASPNGMASLLDLLATGKLLSAASTTYLLNVMEQTVTFPDRLKAGVTNGWTLGHKTGSSGDYEGVTVAINDVGILRAPDGRRISIAVFISDTRASSADCGALMAKFARAAIAHYR